MSPSPRTAVKTLLIAAAVTLTLSASLASCNRDKKPASAPPIPTPAPAVAIPADAGAPFSFKSANTFASTELKLPQGIKGQPDLHASLYAAAVRDLKTFTEGAQADKTEAGGDGNPAPYEKTITFETPVETGKLLSLARQDYEFTGGAHGMTTFAGVMWDKATKTVLQPSALFKQTDLGALDVTLCAAINAEKKRRDPAALTVPLTGKEWSCPKVSDTPYTLAAGSTPGKAGGLVFLIGPYQIGPYSDGTYEITVPQSQFRALLSPAYADEFAGTPLPTPPSSPPSSPAI